jgi:hypothetical protein
MNDEAKKRLLLKDGETLVHENHRMKGTLQETDIDTYAILNFAGEKIGSVVHTDHTAINGFHRTQSIEQRDSSGKLVVDVRW